MKSFTPEQVNGLVKAGSLSLGDRIKVVTFDCEGPIVSEELVLNVTPEYVDVRVCSMNGSVSNENSFRFRYHSGTVVSGFGGWYNNKSNRWVA